MNFGCNCSIDCFFMFIKWKLLSAKSLVASRWVFPTDVHGSNSPSHIVTIEINKKWKLLSTCSLVSALHLICASRWVLHKIEDIQHFLCLVLFWVISTNWNVYICIEVVFSFPFAKGLMYTTAVDWCDGTGSSMYDCSPACCLSFGSSSSWLCDCEV